MSKQPRIRPLPSLAAPVVRIVATPITRGFRYVVAPEGRGRVISYRLSAARATAHLYSRRVVEVGPRVAFDGRRR